MHDSSFTDASAAGPPPTELRLSACPSPTAPPSDDPGSADPQEQLQKGLALSYAYLNRRERSRSELSVHLERKGIDARIAARCLQELTELGYLDDRRYALMFVHDKRELQGWGADRIRRGLSERGIDREAIEMALAEHEAEWAAGESELDRAVALLARRFPDPPRERAERDRALGVLIRRGFDSELALDALSVYARGR